MQRSRPCCEWISTIFSGAAVCYDDSNRKLLSMKNITPQIDKSFFKSVKKKAVKMISNMIYCNEYCQYSSQNIGEIIFETALQKLSLESNATLPDSDTVFYRLGKSDITMESTESMLYESRSQSHEPVIVLFDCHDDMYYGKRRKRNNKKVRVVGTQPKEGSHYAFKYLTVKRLHGEIVYTCPLFGNSVTDSCIKIIEELSKSYTILYVVGDGGFPSSLFLDYLKSIKMHFVFRFGSNTKLRDMKIQYNTLTEYTTTHKYGWTKHHETIPVSFYVCRYHGAKKKDGKRKDFYIISDQKMGSRKLRKSLKDRWDIESGFRDIEKLTIFTTTTDWLLRFFFHVVACVIYNIWIQIKGCFSIRLRELILSILLTEPAHIFKILEKRKRYFAINEST